MEQPMQVEKDTAELSFEVLRKRAVQMFTGGAEASIVFILDVLAAEPTVELCALAKDVVQRLWEGKEHRDAICRSPERPDLRLSQEEALGYLLG